jgi:ATP-binding cassette subfamily F protein uup
VLLVSHDRDFLDRVVTGTLAADGGGRWIEYAGGYSDMIAQRGGAPGAASAADKPRKSKEAKSAGQPSTAKPARLSFKEQHALKTLPERMEMLQADIARLRTLLADPGFYGRDPAGFEKTAESLREAEKAYAAAEDEWLILELKREELEGA